MWETPMIERVLLNLFLCLVHELFHGHLENNQLLLFQLLKQNLWQQALMLLAELHFTQYDPTIIFCDNSSAIKLSKNLVLHGRSKHIDVKFHFLRDLTKDETIEVVLL